MSGVAAAVAGGSLISGYMSGEASKEAAETTAEAYRSGQALTESQYRQTQQALEPYRAVALGELTGQQFNEQAYQQALEQYDKDVADITGSFGVSRLAQEQERAAIQALGRRPARADFTTEARTGGALQTLAEYGPSKVVEGQYIPRNIDIYSDPSYQFRVSEQERAINRAAAGQGKLLSGNRLEEIMRRSGEMASQEYQNIYSRGVGEYERAYAREQDYLNYLRNLAGTGQVATTAGIQAGQQYARTGAELTARAGEAQAAGQIGQAQAYGTALQGVSQAAGMYMAGQNPYGGYGQPINYQYYRR